MKKKILPIILLIIPALILFFSVSLIVMGHPTTEFGLPPYAIQTSKDVEEPVSFVNHTEFKPGNILLMFSILSVPVFFSGYLWAKSKYKLPNKSSDPT